MQSNGNQNETAAGGLGTVEIGGVTYLVRPPTDVDFATLRRHLKKELENPLHAILPDLKGLPPDVRAEAIKAAVELKAGGGAKLTEEYVREKLFQPAGAAFLAWLLIRDQHPGLELETLRPHFTDDNAGERLADLYRAGALEDAAGGKATGRPGSSNGTPATAPASTAS